jgi:hypothetical protein
VADTAACVGIRVPSNWWAPRLSTSSTGGSTSRSGRSTHAAMIASYVPCRRSVPYTSSVASAASRPSKSPFSRAFRSSGGSTRFAYASRSSTARNASKASIRTGSFFGRRYGLPC